MRFCTVINCMDGRVQLPVIRHMKERFNAEYVDSITEPGPNNLFRYLQAQGTSDTLLYRDLP